MKLRAVTLTNVRRFTTPVRIGPIADGLNLLAAANEHGKSTLFDAIHALFFTRHSARSSEVKTLRPYAGGAPEVSIDIETAEGAFTLTKRWFSKPVATVHRNGQLIAQADAAEDWIAATLSGGEGGPVGLIWVRQGVLALSDGSRTDQARALEVRRDLLSSVTGEVEAMTGGRRMDAALKRCRADLAVHVTATGRPLANGPWKDAQDRVAQLSAERDDLAATADTLRADLSARRTARRARSDLTAPEAIAERTTRLNTATAALRTATRHHADLEALGQKLSMARLSLREAEGQLSALRKATCEVGEAGTLETTARKDRDALIEAARQQAETLNGARADLAAAETALQEASATRLQALRQQSALEGAGRRAELVQRIANAEDARRQSETHDAAVQGPDAKAMTRLDGLLQTLRTARALRDSAAVQVVVHYADGAAGRVVMGDVPLADGTPQAVLGDTVLHLDGIGRLDLRPGQTTKGASDVPHAEHALSDALSALGVATMDQATAAFAARQTAEKQRDGARNRLEALAPHGLPALLAALAQIPEPAMGAALPDAEQAERAVQSATEAHVKAESIARQAGQAAGTLEARLAGAEAHFSAARDRLERAKALAGGLAVSDEPALMAERDTAAATVERLTTEYAAKEQAAPDLDSVQASHDRAKAICEQADRETGDLAVELARLDTRIAALAADGIDERLAEVSGALQRAEADQARIGFEVAVLHRLAEALDTARSAARERYFAPVVAELKPLLHLLWPDAQLTWDDSTLLPHALIRNDMEEPLDILSGGTREQIALLVRLAFARMLARGGQAAPVILDDALVFSDDDRIERMFDALHRQAGDLQIIVLSCRQRAFRDLGGTTLRLQPADT